MEVFFKRNLLQSYMVIESDFYSGYDMEMLKRNRLPGFLPFEVTESDGSWQFWYEITGLQMLDEYMKQKPVDYALLKKIVLQIDTAMQLAGEYLLIEEDISLLPERMGIRQESGQLYFCYLKGEDKSPAGQFQNLIEQILPNVDHKDTQAVEAVYAIYEIVLAEHFDFLDVKKVFLEKDEKPYETPKTSEDTRQMTAEDTVYERREKAEERFFSLSEKKYKKLFGLFGRQKKEMAPEIQVSFEPDEEEIKESVHPTVLLSDVSGMIGKLNYNGRNGEADYLIQTEEFKVGTKEGEVDACLKSAAVSRVHARITKKEDEYYIEDLNSKNGTWVDGELLNYKERRKLEKNTRIRFADEEYIFS